VTYPTASAQHKHDRSCDTYSIRSEWVRAVAHHGLHLVSVFTSKVVLMLNWCPVVSARASPSRKKVNILQHAVETLSDFPDRGAESATCDSDKLVRDPLLAIEVLAVHSGVSLVCQRLETQTLFCQVGSSHEGRARASPWATCRFSFVSLNKENMPS
jgi:hypothetical protein